MVVKFIGGLAYERSLNGACYLTDGSLAVSCQPPHIDAADKSCAAAEAFTPAWLCTQKLYVRPYFVRFQAFSHMTFKVAIGTINVTDRHTYGEKSCVPYLE